MNWFERHLNWTVILAWVAGNIIIRLASATNSIVIILIAVFIGVVLTFYPAGWALRKKGRNLVWVLLLFIPLPGGIIFLCLENRHEKEEVSPEEEVKEVKKDLRR